MERLITRRVYGVVDHRLGKLAAIRHCFTLMEEAITLVSGGVVPEVLKIAAKMDRMTNLGMMAWVDLINRATESPVNVSVGGHRRMTWMSQRFETLGGSGYAVLHVSVYWPEDEHMTVRLEGTPDGMRLCRINSLWRPADAQYYEVATAPLSLEAAIAQAAEHGV